MPLNYYSCMSMEIVSHGHPKSTIRWQIDLLGVVETYSNTPLRVNGWDFPPSVTTKEVFRMKGIKKRKNLKQINVICEYIMPNI